MAQSLETAIVLPICLGLMIGLAGQVLPILIETQTVARQAAEAQVNRLSLSHLYRMDGQVLQTSPQHVVEWIELIRQIGVQIPSLDALA